MTAGVYSHTRRTYVHTGYGRTYTALQFEYIPSRSKEKLFQKKKKNDSLYNANKMNAIFKNKIYFYILAYTYAGTAHRKFHLFHTLEYFINILFTSRKFKFVRNLVYLGHELIVQCICMYVKDIKCILRVMKNKCQRHF